jgi:hypothetical protein
MNLLFLKQLEEDGINIQMSAHNKQLLEIQDELENAMKEDMMSEDEIQKSGTKTTVLSD